MTDRSFVAILFVVALLLPFCAMAQLDGWTKGKGNTDLAFGTTFEQGSGFYEGMELRDNYQRTKVVASIFAAHGFTKDLDVILNLPYVNIGGSGGFQDAALWLKWAPIQTNIGEKWKFSLITAAGISVPMTNYTTYSSNAIGQQATAFMPMGLAQFQHYNSGIFFNFSSGYFFKSDPTPDLVPFQFKVGLAKSKYYLELYFDMGESQGGKDYSGTGDLEPDPEEEFKDLGASWQKVGAKYYKPLTERYGISIEAFKVLNGRNYDDSFGIAASFIWKISAKKKNEE